MPIQSFTNKVPIPKVTDNVAIQHSVNDDRYTRDDQSFKAPPLYDKCNEQRCLVSNEHHRPSANNAQKSRPQEGQDPNDSADQSDDRSQKNSKSRPETRPFQTIHYSRDSICYFSHARNSPHARIIIQTQRKCVRHLESSHPTNIRFHR